MSEGDGFFRREVLQLTGAVGLAALSDPATGQISAEDVDTDVAEYGLLLGADDHRPPQDDLDQRFDTYHFVYKASDTGNEYEIRHTDNGWNTLPMSLEKYETGFGFPAVRASSSRIDAPAGYDYNTGRHRLEINGTFIKDVSATSKFTDGTPWQITASAGDTIEFGVRELTRYVPNYELLWGCASWAESELTTGQSVFIEFTNDDRTDGYRYRFEPDEWYVEQLSSGVGGGGDNVVQSKPTSEWMYDPRDNGFSLTSPFVARDYFNWYGAGNSRFTFSFPDADDKMVNDTVARTSNSNGLASEQVNNRVKVVVDLDAGASDLTYNVGSFGTLIQGQAGKYNRGKIGTHFDLGGSISQFPTENDPVLAIRIDPERANTAVQLPTPIFAPTSASMEMTVYGVLESDTDADFLDVDGDGTNEGPVYASQTQAQNSVVQWTRNVSTFPTTTGQRMDNTTGQVVDARQITSAVSTGSGNKNDPPVSSAGGSITVKRVLFPGEVGLFIPRTFPQSSTTAGAIDFIQSFSEQDW